MPRFTPSLAERNKEFIELDDVVTCNCRLDSLRQYSDFAEFVDDLSLSLNGATTARSLHARGHYESDTNTLTAYKLGVYVIEP